MSTASTASRRTEANKIVILTGAGGEFIPAIDFASFGNVADPEVWSQVHDEGVQILENLANIRVPVIAAIEGQANVHSEYALLANVIVAGEGATFNDLPHFAGGIVPGDGIFTAWSYRAGAGRAEAFLLNPQPVTARTAYEWGVVAEVVPDGQTLARAHELASLYLKRAPEVTRRSTRAHFIQPREGTHRARGRLRTFARRRLSSGSHQSDAIREVRRLAQIPPARKNNPRPLSRISTCEFLQYSTDETHVSQAYSATGETISHYHVLEELGSGGMDEIYQAQDNEGRRFVALKFLPRRARRAGPSGSGTLSPRSTRRLRAQSSQYLHDLRNRKP